MTQTMREASTYFLPFPGCNMIRVAAPVSAQDLEEFARARVETLRGLMKGKRGRNRARLEGDVKRYLGLAENAASFSEFLHNQALQGKKLEVMF